MRKHDTTRFFSMVEKTETCWLWIGGAQKGYGRYSNEGAHRVSYRLARGDFPRELEIDHLCGVPLCVNPDHLEPVDRMENMRRRYAGMTHCHRGHEFTVENTYIRQHHRTCRACNRIAVAAYAARRAGRVAS